jgi:hypothetical protein
MKRSGFARNYCVVGWCLCVHTVLLRQWGGGVRDVRILRGVGPRGQWGRADGVMIGSRRMRYASSLRGSGQCKRINFRRNANCCSLISTSTHHGNGALPARLSGPVGPPTIMQE